MNALRGTVTVEAMSPGVYMVTVDGRRHLVHYASDRARHFVHVDSETYLFEGDPTAVGPTVGGRGAMLMMSASRAPRRSMRGPAPASMIGGLGC